jgi:hypothetical protein
MESPGGPALQNAVPRASVGSPSPVPVDLSHLLDHSHGAGRAGLPLASRARAPIASLADLLAPSRSSSTSEGTMAAVGQVGERICKVR